MVGAPPEGRIEVHQVDPLGPGAHPVPSGVDGAAVVRLRTNLSLKEPDGLAIGDVDSGK